MRACGNSPMLKWGQHEEISAVGRSVQTRRPRSLPPRPALDHALPDSAGGLPRRTSRRTPCPVAKAAWKTPAEIKKLPFTSAHRKVLRMGKRIRLRHCFFASRSSIVADACRLICGCACACAANRGFATSLTRRGRAGRGRTRGKWIAGRSASCAGHLGKPSYGNARYPLSSTG
jgi:hypothetical protein